MSEITVTDLRGNECTLIGGDCFKAYAKGVKVTLYQFLGLMHGTEKDVYLLDVDSMEYMNVNRSWFNSLKIRKLKRGNCYQTD